MFSFGNKDTDCTLAKASCSPDILGQMAEIKSSRYLTVPLLLERGPIESDPGVDSPQGLCLLRAILASKQRRTMTRKGVYNQKNFKKGETKLS